MAKPGPQEETVLHTTTLIQDHVTKLTSFPGLFFGRVAAAVGGVRTVAGGGRVVSWTSFLVCDDIINNRSDEISNNT